MCSNWNNNRRHHVSYYVTDVNGVSTDRTSITNPVLKTAGMPKRIDCPVCAATRRAPRPYAHTAIEDKVKVKANKPANNRVAKPLPPRRARKSAARAIELLSRVTREDFEGLAAAQQLTPRQAPAQVFSAEALVAKCYEYGANPTAHRLVKGNIMAHSTMMTVVDLRDDKVRAPNGETICRGAIYAPRLGRRAEKISLLLYVEYSGNQRRALEELRRVARLCPNLRELGVEVAGENNLAAAKEVVRVLEEDFATAFNPTAVEATFRSSLYEDSE
jgi:hypothetical protein